MAVRKRRCIKRGRKKVLQDYGPAKTVTYCKKFGPATSSGSKKRKRRGRKRTGWCVHRGKQVVSCHRTKRVANKRAASVRRGCKSKVTVRRKKAA